MQSVLIALLMAGAAAQVGVAVLNLLLIRLLRWQDDLKRLSLLPRQVFVVHLLFISITLMIFGVLTWRFAGAMVGGTSEVAAWLAGSIAVFWILRAILQVTYYSGQHWRGKVPQTVAHAVLLFVYGGMAVTYGWAALRAFA